MISNIATSDIESCSGNNGSGEDNTSPTFRNPRVTDENTSSAAELTQQLSLVTSAMNFADRSAPGLAHRVTLADGLAMLCGVLKALEPRGGFPLKPLTRTSPEDHCDRVRVREIRSGPPSTHLDELSRLLTATLRSSVGGAGTLPGKAKTVPRLKSTRAPKKGSPKKDKQAQGKTAPKPNHSGDTGNSLPSPDCDDVARRERGKLMKKAMRSFKSKGWSRILESLKVSEDDVRSAVANCTKDTLFGDKTSPPLERLGLIDYEKLASTDWANSTEAHMLVKQAKTRSAIAGSDSWKTPAGWETRVFTLNSNEPSTRRQIIIHLRRSLFEHRRQFGLTGDFTDPPLITMLAQGAAEDKKFYVRLNVTFKSPDANVDTQKFRMSAIALDDSRFAVVREFPPTKDDLDHSKGKVFETYRTELKAQLLKKKAAKAALRQNPDPNRDGNSAPDSGIPPDREDSKSVRQKKPVKSGSTSKRDASC